MQTDGEAAPAEAAEVRDITWAPDMFSTVCAQHNSSLWTGYSQLHKAARGKLDRSRIIVWRCGEQDLCGGIGNQVRGLTVALYVAMLSRRALFIEWKHPGHGDITSLMRPRGIDWRTPGMELFSTCVTHYSIDTCHGGTDGCDVIRFMKEQDPCIVVVTNAVPSKFWHEISKVPNVAYPLQQAIRSGFLVGCAMHFLFDSSGFLERLDANVRLISASQSSIPVQRKLRYVGVHMRFGDAFFGDDDPKQASSIDAALRCAHSLGKSLFDPHERWGIFFASDNPASRRYALQASLEIGVSVLECEFAPMHSDKCTHGCGGDDRIWNYWADLLLLTRARGLVTGTALSDYSQVAAQLRFMPFVDQRVSAGDGSCASLQNAESVI